MIHLKGEEKVSTLRRRFTNEEGGTLLFEGRRIRLVDLDEIKRQWRLEGDRFAFISQGEVSEVIQQKPLQRRMHLESLFGIDLYRKQREEAVQKLDAATLELQRIMTLQSELRTRKEVIADPVLRAREAKAVIDAGLGGPLRLATSETSWCRGSDYYSAAWRGTWSGEGGGAVFGHGTHAHDLISYLAGPLTSVTGQVATLVNDIEEY